MLFDVSEKLSKVRTADKMQNNDKIIQCNARKIYKDETILRE